MVPNKSRFSERNRFEHEKGGLEKSRGGGLQEDLSMGNGN
jgi:hypothetical protein